MQVFLHCNIWGVCKCLAYYILKESQKGFIGLHNDVNINIVIIYKKRKFIRFHLQLKALWCIVSVQCDTVNTIALCRFSRLFTLSYQEVSHCESRFFVWIWSITARYYVDSSYSSDGYSVSCLGVYLPVFYPMLLL